MLTVVTRFNQVDIYNSDNCFEDFLPLLQPGKTLVVTSQSFTERGLTARVTEQLKVDDYLVIDHIKPNPELSDIDSLLELIKQWQIVNIVALGGGSVLDTAKVLKFAISRQLWLCREILSKQQQQATSVVNLLAIPTTSGTGAEVTPFATVWESHSQKKHSVIHCAPDIAILDPHLCLTLDTRQTLYPALDALSHGLESLWNKNRSEASEKFANEAVTLVLDALPKIIKTPDDLRVRRQLLEAACYAGIAIAQTKTAIAHAISYPFTMQFGVPHGLACSFTLSAIIRLYGAEALKLPPKLADKVTKTLDTLNLSAEIGRYLKQESVDLQPFAELEPSRAGNFVCEFSPEQVKHIIEQSMR